MVFAEQESAGVEGYEMPIVQQNGVIVVCPQNRITGFLSEAFRIEERMSLSGKRMLSLVTS